MPRRLLAILAAFVLLLPCISRAAETAVIVDDGKPGTYLLTVNADGTVTVNPIRVVRPGQSPVPPTSPPVESPLSKSVRQLTTTALSKGGSPVQAANIAAIYALVSDDCSDLPGKPAKLGMPQLASPLISAATDEVLKDATAAEKAAWSEWRTLVGSHLGNVAGIGTDKAATAKALDEVATGVQAAINSAAVAEPGILDGINWERIRELLRPILQRLLDQLIDELLKKLPL